MKFVCLLSMLLLMFSCSKTSLKYPKTLKENTVDNYFGIEVPDPYRWLEDDRTEQTLEWVKSQNELTFSYLEKIPFRDKITKRLTDIYNYPRMSAPWKESDYYFMPSTMDYKIRMFIIILNQLKKRVRFLLTRIPFLKKEQLHLRTSRFPKTANMSVMEYQGEDLTGGNFL